MTPELERDAIPAEYTWNLADLFPSIDAWRAEKARLESRATAMAAYEGRLGSSAAVLSDALDELHAFEKDLGRTFVYAGLLADQDTRASGPEAMRREMVQLAAAFGAAAAYVEPEILRFEPGLVETFLASEPRLANYRVFLTDLARRAAHTLSPAEEKLLADLAPLAGSPSSVYTILTNADFPYPSVTLHDGARVTLTPAKFAAHRASPNRADRQLVMSAYFESLGRFGRTLGTTMNASLQRSWFFAKTRRYGSSLEAALDGPNIPAAVYRQLVDGVTRHLPSFHRYLDLRRRMLSLPALHYYDLYAPLVASVSLSYTPAEAEAHILASMAPLGEPYTDVLRRAFRERWIDVFPTPGKRSGAYSNGGAYDVHPYMLLNYNGKYDDMSTVTHELGHAMHSYLSNRTQPFATAGYHTFVAEVASTFNESLLLDHMRRTIDDDDIELSLLGNYLESIKGTVFRQTQFAEFELRMHEWADAGRPIIGDALAELYLGITRKYYGHDTGVTVVDDDVAHEWSFIPHFYRDFYVFQYATSFTASEALAGRVKAGDRAATDRYLAFLSSGGSKHPIELLKDAGVDMTTDEPLELTIQQMNRVMDDMERLLARRGRT